MTQNLTFLKLGGSLITEKSEKSTVNNFMLCSACKQIAEALNDFPAMKLLIGHGSGSFGHHAGSKYGTKDGIIPNSNSDENKNYWQGFYEVYQQAHLLNQYVLNEFHKAAIPVINFPPAVLVTTSNREIVAWDVNNIANAIESGFVPIIFGDVVFDQKIGGTILSTEDLFGYLTHKLSPSRILLAGIEEGVWEDYPVNNKLIEQIDQSNFLKFQKALGDSNAIDVTGGMNSKVEQMLRLTIDQPDLTTRIFSGRVNGSIYKALAGLPIGTLIKS